MISPEQAKADLEKLENKKWTVHRLTQVVALPGTVERAGRCILGVDAEGKELTDFQKRDESLLAFGREIDALPTPERVRFFDVLLPGIGHYVEAAWQTMQRGPYQIGYLNKCFRAPHRTEFTLSSRMRWLVILSEDLGPYSQTITWYAAWAVHIAILGRADMLGVLLAAAIDAGGKEGDEVFQILVDSTVGEHEIGGMGRHVISALLHCARPEAWAFMEKILLAAQREEGLRQVILEMVDEAHPEAFRRMLKLILSENLARFSATVRAIDVWFKFGWDAVSVGVVNKTLEKVLLYLEDPAARTDALSARDAEQVYLALWTMAFEDAMTAIEPANELLKHKSVEHRFVAAHFLKQLGLVEAQQKLLAALDDSDLRVAACALGSLSWNVDESVQKLGLFERLEKLIPRFPRKKETLKPIVWPWSIFSIEQDSVATALLANLGERPPSRLIPYLGQMNPQHRASVARLLSESKTWDAPIRDALFSLLGDASPSVRQAALQGLEKCQAVDTAEAEAIERLLTRQVGDLRRGALMLLLKQEDKAVLTSADRLLGAAAAPQRQAGLELLRQLVEHGRTVAECQTRANAYKESHPVLNEQEHQHFDVIAGSGRQSVTLDDSLGLVKPEERTWPPKPVARPVQLHSSTTNRLILALEELIERHKETPITYVDRYEGGEQQILLGHASYHFPAPQYDVPIEKDIERLPLREVWEKWFQSRGKDLRDDDGFEMLRVLAAFFSQRGAFGIEESELWKRARPQLECIFGKVFGKEKFPVLKHTYVVRDVIEWMLKLHPPAGIAEFMLDAIETTFAQVPESELTYVRKRDDWRDKDWRSDDSPFRTWENLARLCCHYWPSLWTDAQRVRHWPLLRWQDEPLSTPGTPVASLSRNRAELELLLAARPAGGATDADVIDQLLGPREFDSPSDFRDLHTLTPRKPSPLLERYPFAKPLVDRCIDRILDVELARGDTPTAASPAALHLRSVWGIENLLKILRALGKRNFVRNWSYNDQTRETVLSKLTRASFPTDSDTAADFQARTKAAGISEQRLIEVAVYAPQWASFVEQALGWKSLEDAVWWIHAHTKDTSWQVEEQVREVWQAQVTERTRLTGQDLVDGAVDVVWFHRVHKDLGPARWAKLDEAAKYASGGAGHARAQLFANAMLAQVKQKELATRIAQKRNQDAVRALGLLPLADGKSREADLLNRYKILQEFIRTSRQFGSQRQASEKRAAQIGQENLARTAGYPDPIRLQWAMEAKAIEDLAKGPIRVKADDITVTLSVDQWGGVDLAVEKDGKPLADVPSKLKKHAKIAELRERRTELKRQVSRIRPSLEQLMCRGETFTARELQELLQHPLLGPMLSNLVLAGDGIAGYPTHGGKTLEDHSGKTEALKKDERLRIAHPHDLLPADNWHLWQRDCLARERIQPFKQVFREYYPLTKTEIAEETQSRRYAGHQVQPRKAVALLGVRGWVVHPEEGVRRTFHDLGLSAWLEFQEPYWTPAEVEGWTLESVHFTRRGGWDKLKLKEIPPLLFSEVMRDLDLVVSVAHRGGIDPEASASTVEMRSALLRDTLALLKISNVRVKENHALIEGKLGEYSVHLGSAVAHRMPGGALLLVAVHGQHRGRLFLPFADDDPKTAEVLSKVLLLARDSEIKDPGILDQIRSG